jgi:hypothetical protein
LDTNWHLNNKSLISLALPREATELSDVNDLAKGLGKNSFIDLQRVSESPPKPSAEQNRGATRSRINRPLTVTRGRELLGLLDQHAQAFEAFDTDRRRPGRFATQKTQSNTLATTPAVLPCRFAAMKRALE